MGRPRVGEVGAQALGAPPDHNVVRLGNEGDVGRGGRVVPANQRGQDVSAQGTGHLLDGRRAGRGARRRLGVPGARRGEQQRDGESPDLESSHGWASYRRPLVTSARDNVACFATAGRSSCCSRPCWSGFPRGSSPPCAWGTRAGRSPSPRPSPILLAPRRHPPAPGGGVPGEPIAGRPGGHRRHPGGGELRPGRVLAGRRDRRRGNGPAGVRGDRRRPGRRGAAGHHARRGGPHDRRSDRAATAPPRGPVGSGHPGRGVGRAPAAGPRGAVAARERGDPGPGPGTVAGPAGADGGRGVHPRGGGRVATARHGRHHHHDRHRRPAPGPRDHRQHRDERRGAR